MGQRPGPLEAVVMLDPAFWRGRRVLLTGHTGFKGSWLTLWLLSLGAEVWGYALAPEPGLALFTDLGLVQSRGDADWGHLRHRLGDVCDLEALGDYRDRNDTHTRESSLIIPDRSKNCATETWNIEVPNGDYR